MNIKLTTILLFSTLALAASCQTGCTGGKGGGISGLDGVLVNEIAAHDQTVDAATCVELLNSSSRDIDISGVSLYLTDQYFDRKCIYTAPEGTVLSPGERLCLSTSDETLLTGIASDSDFTLKLALSASGKAIDEFSPLKAFGKVSVQTARGSYQRIPDGAPEWRNLTYSSPGRENAVFDLDGTRRHGLWTWSSHISGLTANDCAELKALKAKGIDHIILNYDAFHPTSRKSTVAFIEAAESLGLTVHAWIQCFHNSGGWINPIDDENARFKDDVFEGIVANAKSYIEDYGVKGIHLDYIRFGGTAQKHNVNDEVNSVEAVTRCCREIRELCDSYSEGLVTSAAMMPDETASGTYYGQNRARMGEYIHIFMPMIYRYSYGYSDEGCRKKADEFSGHGAECWAGTTTYRGNDSGVIPMDAAGVLKDCEVYKGTQASGIVLFRCALGEIPDLSDFTLE